MIRAKGLLSDFKGPLLEKFRFQVATLIPV